MTRKLSALFLLGVVVNVFTMVVLNTLAFLPFVVACAWICALVDQSTRAPAKSVEDLFQHSLWLERQCGLVFTEWTRNLHWMWSGYWEWKEQVVCTNPCAGGELIESRTWYVRPEGSTEDKWVKVAPDVDHDKALELLASGPIHLLEPKASKPKHSKYPAGGHIKYRQPPPKPKLSSCSKATAGLSAGLHVYNVDGVCVNCSHRWTPFN